MKRNIPRSKNSDAKDVKIPCQDWYALLDSQANVPNRLQALLKELPDEEQDEARDRAHAAGIWQQPESWEATFQKLPPTSSGYQLFLEVVRSRAAERICRISMCAWLAKSIWI